MDRLEVVVWGEVKSGLEVLETRKMLAMLLDLEGVDRT